MNFNIKKTINYWYTSSEYDLETAGSLFDKKKYPYALFFGHLAIETFKSFGGQSYRNTCAIHTFSGISCK